MAGEGITSGKELAADSLDCPAPLRGIVGTSGVGL